MRLKAVVLSGLGLLSNLSFAGYSGGLEVLAGADNRYFQAESFFVKRLNVLYLNDDKAMLGNLSLIVSRRESQVRDGLNTLYLEKGINDSRQVVTLGRFPRSDGLGFYTLDGAQIKWRTTQTVQTLYAGVPKRIVGLDSFNNELMYGLDWNTSLLKSQHFQHQGGFSWQSQKTSGSELVERSTRNEWQNRAGVTWRGELTNDAYWLPTALFSFSGHYIVSQSRWESLKVSSYYDFRRSDALARDDNPKRKFKAKRQHRVRLNYERLNGVKEALTFKEQFFHGYSRGKQSQFRVGLQMNPDFKTSWTVGARSVQNEWGSEGVGALASVNLRRKTWRWMSQVERLQLSEEYRTSLYVEGQRPLSAMSRYRLAGMLLKQRQFLTGTNYSQGLELQFERRIRLGRLPSAINFSTEGRYIHNSQWDNEYRVALRLVYRFDRRRGGLFD